MREAARRVGGSVEAVLRDRGLTAKLRALQAAVEKHGPVAAAHADKYGLPPNILETHSVSKAAGGGLRLVRKEPRRAIGPLHTD